MNPIISDALVIILCGGLAFIWIMLVSVPFAISVPEDNRVWQAISATTWLVFAGGGVAFFVYTAVHMWR